MAALYPGIIRADFVDRYAQNPLAPDRFRELIEEIYAAFVTLGTNPQGDKGTVDNRLDTVEALEAISYRNLRVANNATTPTTKLDVTADLVDLEGDLVTDVSVVIDLTAAGKNGTAFSRATNTWYFVWLGLNPTTGEVCGLFDNEYLRANLDTSHASLAGFTRWRRVGARRTNATGSGEFPRGAQQDAILLYDEPGAASVGVSGTGASWNTKSLADAVPVTSRQGYIVLGLDTDADGAPTSVTLAVRPKGSTSSVGLICFQRNDGASAQHAHIWLGLNASQEFEWMLDNTVTSGTDLGAIGYHDPI